MAYWLLKADPDDYGYNDLQRDRKARWDGVANPLALKHMRNVRKGDHVLVYHTGSEKQIVGQAVVTKDAYVDPDGNDERRVVFDLEPRKSWARPLSLAAIKADARFAGFELVRMPRLSVMPVPGPLWKLLLSMADEG